MSGHLNERQAARYLDVSPTFLRHLRERGLVRVAGYRRFRTPVYREDDLDACLLELYRHKTYDFGERITLVYD